MDETAGSIESEIILESFSFTGQCKVDTSVKMVVIMHYSCV